MLGSYFVVAHMVFQEAEKLTTSGG